MLFWSSGILSLSNLSGEPIIVPVKKFLIWKVLRRLSAQQLFLSFQIQVFQSDRDRVFTEQGRYDAPNASKLWPEYLQLKQPDGTNSKPLLPGSFPDWNPDFWSEDSWGTCFANHRLDSESNSKQCYTSNVALSCHVMTLKMDFGLWKNFRSDSPYCSCLLWSVLPIW